MTPSLVQVGAALALAALASAVQAAPVYALAGNNGTLVRFDTATPGTVTSVGALSGATTALDGLDFRPADGMLYGYNAATSGIYRVDPNTGVTTLFSTSSAPVSTSALGIDFNPVADRLRVVTANDENRRINVANGVALSDGTLAYAAGDANTGVNPNVVEAAYTNNDNNPATGTTLFYIDDVLNILVSTANPNAGLLNTVGALGVDTDQFLGFDIFTDLGGLNQAFASLQVGGVQGLYSINLGTGAATLLGAIGMNRLHGLAVAPALVPVPEPGSLALVAVAGLAVMTLRRRRGAMAQPNDLLDTAGAARPGIRR